MTIKYSKLSPYKTKKIIRCFCSDLTALQASEITWHNRNTINRYYNIFREKIYKKQLEELRQLLWWKNEEVECDESYFGASRVRGYHGKRKRGRWTLKQPVFGVLERNGKVYTEIIPNCKAKTLRNIILWRVSIDTVIYTDWRRWYNGLVDMWYEKHYRVHHGKNEFARGKNHINGIENFWSFTKRRLRKFNGVKANFPYHLKECEWRYWKDHTKLYDELVEMLWI